MGCGARSEQTAALRTGASTPAQEATSQPRLLTVATYNSALMFDHVDDPGESDNNFEAKPEAAMAAFAKTIRAIDADVVGLQEVEHTRVLEAFNKQHLEGAGYTVWTDAPTDSFNVALLSRLPIKRVKRLGDPADGVESSFRYLRHRMVYFEAELPDGSPLHIVVVHLKAQQDERSRQMRLDMADALLAWLREDLKLSPQSDPIVIMGDFNDTPESATLRRFLQAQEGGFADYTGLERGKHFTMSSAEPKGQIDFILGSTPITRRYVPRSARVPAAVDLNTLRAGSDHLPLIAAFVVGGPSDGSREELIKHLPEPDNAKLDRILSIPSPLRLIDERDKAALDAAHAAGPAATPLAKIREEFQAWTKEQGETPVHFAEGTVMSDPRKLVAGRLQFSLMDASGGLLIDQRGEENFPQMPAIGDRIRVTGRATSYRDIVQFMPVAPVEILGKATELPTVRTVSPAELVAEASALMSTVVAVDGAIGGRDNASSGTKFDLQAADGSGPKIEVWVPKIAFEPPALGDGVTIRVRGVVSKYRDAYQIQVTDPASLAPLAP